MPLVQSSSPVTRTTGSAGPKNRALTLLIFSFSYDGKVGYEHLYKKGKIPLWYSSFLRTVMGARIALAHKKNNKEI
jgi:hypothetical protein